MQRISITNPQNIIDGTAKKYYFKLRNTGGPKGDKGDKGDTGATGPQGPQGDPCTVVVNSTATLEPGSNAYVTNTGSLSNAVLNFGIPKGDRGPQGAKGDKGDTGAQGETGPRGPQGERGTNATVSIGTTYTLAPDSQATVYNSGSDSNAVLNFGIPKGEKGATGPQGPTGPAGQNFAPTVVTELPATGTEGKLYLTPKNYTTGTATGNPITISLGEDAGQITSFQLDGDTLQNGTPTPSSPVAIQTVTGEQTITINGTGYPINLGKNLLNTSLGFQYGYIDSSGAYISNNTIVLFNQYIEVSSGANYRFSSSHTNRNMTAVFYDASKTFISRVLVNNTSVNSFTTPTNCKYARLQANYNATEMSQEIVDSMGLMLSAGSQATTYAPYKTPIELCKLGTYQDYIYKDGEDWKVHKAISKKTFSDGSSFFQSGRTTSSFLAAAVNLTELDSISLVGNDLVKSPYFRFTGDTPENGGMDIYDGSTYAQNFVCYFDKTAIPDLSTAKNWITEHEPQIVYVRYTPTDTTITDQALIAQLEAIRTASLENGTNTITNTATGSNLAGDMEIGYYGYNPTNRYDKWLWLDLNNNYEQIGS